MSRYLTPAKIGLIILIELYVNRAVPNDAVRPVLEFLSCHLVRQDPSKAAENPDGKWTPAERAVSVVIGITDFEHLLGGWPFLRGMPGRRLWDQFLERLWGIDSLHGLNDFFESLGYMFAKTPEEARMLAELGVPPEPQETIRLSTGSPFGNFVRRSVAEFYRLRFQDHIELWKDLVCYRQVTAPYVKRKMPGFNRLSFDRVLWIGAVKDWGVSSTIDLASVAYGDMLSADVDERLPVSADDINKLLEFQIGQMQFYGSRVPSELRHQFHDLLKDCCLYPATAHYLDFLDAWRAGNYAAAINLLHRYFDYTMQNRTHTFYQYALLNLAVLQADFGCYTESVGAMLESIVAARENKDLTCLNFATNWLFHFGRAHPDLIQDLESNSMTQTGTETLAFLRVKAREAGMYSLWSTVMLSEAKFGLVKGDSVARSLEYIAKSSHLNVMYNMQNMMGGQMGLQTAFYDRLGLGFRANTTMQIFLWRHAKRTIFDDHLKLTCRWALSLAEWGKYDEALQWLDSLDDNSLRSTKSGTCWQKCKGIINVIRDLRHNNLDGAERLLSQLLPSKKDDVEPNLAFIIGTLNIDYLCRRGDLQTAFAELNAMITQLRDEDKDISLRVQLFILKASLYHKCGRTRRGLSAAMLAANISWRCLLIPQLWRSLGAVARILVSLGDFRSAVNLLVPLMPRALECELATLDAELYACLADAYMGMAGEAKPKTTRRMECLMKAGRAVQKSFERYSVFQDVEMQKQMMAKRAMIMKLSGDFALAASYAAAYASLAKSAEALSRGLGHVPAS